VKPVGAIKSSDKFKRSAEKKVEKRLGRLKKTGRVHGSLESRV